MKPYQQRAVHEQNEIKEKLGKLIDFMHSDKYASLIPIEQGLLMVQLAAMESYSHALARRIELF